MQLCKPCVSQKGMHLPERHLPLSRHPVPSGIGGLLGHSAPVPVQRDSCSQVANCPSRHLTPDAIN